MNGLTFNEFVKSANPVKTPLDSKPITFWACELGGECGEVQNIAKKMERDGIERAALRGGSDADLVEEAGDTLLALSWTLRKRGLTLDDAAHFALNKLDEMLQADAS